MNGPGVIGVIAFAVWCAVAVYVIVWHVIDKM